MGLNNTLQESPILFKNHQSNRQTASEPSYRFTDYQHRSYFSSTNPVKAPWLSDDKVGSSRDGRNLWDEASRRGLTKELKRVADLRDTLFGRRLHLKEKRNELRQESGKLSELFDALIMSQKRSKKRLKESHYAELDIQKNVVGSLQYDYDLAEDEYDEHENQLDQEEEKLIKTLRRFFPEDIGEDDSSTDSWESQPQLEQSQESIFNNESHMRVVEYQSRVGDARILQERLQDLLYEQGRRLSFAKMRENYTTYHDDSKSDFTERFESHRTAIVCELKLINGDLQRLKEHLQLDGMDEISPIYRFEEVWTPQLSPLPPQLQDSISPDPKKVRRVNSADLDPTKSLDPEKQKSGSDSALPTTETNSRTAQVRISWWVLRTLLNSPTARVQHKQILRDVEDVFRDNMSWARLVYEVWERDEAGDDTSVGSWRILAQDLIEHKAFQIDILDGTTAVPLNVPDLNDFLDQEFPDMKICQPQIRDTVSQHKSRSV